jgi:hypothetical protein
MQQHPSKKLESGREAHLTCYLVGLAKEKNKKSEKKKGRAPTRPPNLQRRTFSTAI